MMYGENLQQMQFPIIDEYDRFLEALNEEEAQRRAAIVAEAGYVCRAVAADLEAEDDYQCPAQ
mgnify:CR=1 FL=1